MSNAIKINFTSVQQMKTLGLINLTQIRRQENILPLLISLSEDSDHE